MLFGLMYLTSDRRTDFATKKRRQRVSKRAEAGLLRLWCNGRHTNDAWRYRRCCRMFVQQADVVVESVVRDLMERVGVDRLKVSLVERSRKLLRVRES